jgi:DNA-binding FrmR family transcriptional regulator
VRSSGKVSAPAENTNAATGANIAMNAKQQSASKIPQGLRDTRGLVNRVKRLRGQIDGVERALGDKAEVSDLLQRITTVRGAIDGLLAEVLEEHVRENLMGDGGKDSVSQQEAAEALIEIIHSYLT